MAIQSSRGGDYGIDGKAWSSGLAWSDTSFGDRLRDGILALHRYRTSDKSIYHGGSIQLLMLSKSRWLGNVGSLFLA